MNLKELKIDCENRSKDYPILKDEIADFYALAYAEVEMGGSETQECELALQSIEEIIREYEKV